MFPPPLAPSDGPISSINPCDDVKAGFRMMRKGLPDAEKFEKYFPHTTRDLRAGKASEPQLVLDIISMYVKLNVESRGMYMDRLTCMELAKDAAHCALPNRLKQFAKGPFDGEAAWTTLCQSIFFALIDKTKRIDPNNGVTIPVLLKESVDEVCEKKAGEFDTTLFRGKRGQFQKKCPIYNKPAQSYYDAYMPLSPYEGKGNGTCFVTKSQTISEGYNMRHREVSIMVRHVAVNLTSNRRACWECGERPVDGVKECGKCNLASYCSKACQAKAWKEGHKRKCKATRAKYDQFLRLIREDGDEETSFEKELREVHGLSLSFSNQSHMAFELLFKRNGLWEGTTLEHRIGSPSVDHFHKNLCKVARGEWWLYENATDSAFLEASIDHVAEGEYFEGLCMTLFYDFEGIEQSDFDERTPVVALEQLHGAAMPAAKFMLLYKVMACSMSTERNAKDLKCGLYEELRNDFHK